MRSLENGTYDDFCGICGFALQKHQVGAILKGGGYDFNLRCEFVLEITLCSECWSKIQQVHVGGISEAMARMVDLKLDDLGQARERDIKGRGHIANFKKRDKEDDDDGGIAPTQ